MTARRARAPAAPTIAFAAELRATGVTSTGIVVPPARLAALGAGKRPAVQVTLGGAYTYRTTIGAMDGQAMIPVSAAVRAAAGVAAGQRLDVAVSLDRAPRTVDVPEDLATALAAAPRAATAFAALAPSHQRRYTLWIEGAVKAETRAARVAKALVMLVAPKPATRRR